MRRLFCLLCLALPLCLWAKESSSVEERPEPARLAFFLQSGVAFLGFDDRDKFQEATDSIYKDLREEARTEAETLAVSRQTFQKVNLSIPLYAGIQVQPFENHFLSLGTGFIYDDESVVLTDRNSKSHHYSYTLQAIPLFLEYRLAIPPSIISITDASLFSISLRWYWMLPGTEIYSTWGKIGSKPSLLGNGFGISLGYLIASWKSFKIYGDLGFNSITIKSDGYFEDIVPIYKDEEESEKEKARWDLGGLQLQIRISFGVLESKSKTKIEP